MKRIVIILIGLISVAYGQSQPTSSKTRFVNGLYAGTKLDSYFAAADSNAIYWRADSVVMAKYKGTARALAFAVSGGYIPYSDTTSLLSQVVRTFGTQTIGGNKTFSNDIVVNDLTIGKGNGSYSGNIAFGQLALTATIGTGLPNVAIGNSALKDLTSGAGNVAVGNNILNGATTNANNNTAIGQNSLSGVTSGGNNATLGASAGRFNGASATVTSIDNSTYIGGSTKASATTGVTNETVIGYNTTGNGSNTVTIGNSSVTDNYFSGNVRGNGIISDTGYFRGVTRYDSTAKFYKRIIVSPTGNSYFQDFGVNEDGPAYYANRNIDGGTDINEHGFIDATTFKNRTNRAYNSYDAQPRIAGSANLDHVANFQSRGEVSLTGGATITNYWSFYSAPSVQSGNITNLYHFMNIPTIGLASVQNEYGLYVNTLRGNRVYGIYVATDSVFVGNQVEATKFKVTGGTSSQFLKANGTVDATSYAALSGATFTGSVFAPNLYATDKIYLQRSSLSLNLPVASYWDGTTAPLTGTKGDIVAFGNAGGDGVSLANSNTEVVRFDNTSFDIKNTTASTTTTSGALIVRGGAGIVGQLTAATIVKSGGTSTQALIADGSVQTLTSGTYTPTLTNTTSITSSTLTNATYTRVGNIVTVFVSASVTPTSGGTTSELTITLPISSTTPSPIINGLGTNISGSPQEFNVFSGGSSGTTVIARFKPPTGGIAYDFNITFQYTVN